MRRDEERILPAEMIGVFAIGPAICSLLVDHTLISSPWPQVLRRIGVNYIPFCAMLLAFLLLYRSLVPAWIKRVRTQSGRAASHVAIITVAAVAVAQVIFPLHHALMGHHEERLRFTLISVVMSWLFMLPALAVQSLRRHARALELQALAERQAALEAQLSALQARTNPHFFFNSVNTVASLIPDDPELAERTLERLADLFRYALDSSRTRLVPLSREVEMVRDYLAIQSARFGSRLHTEVSLDPAAAAVDVPPLVLQPLVENAILHGLGRRRGGAVAVVARRADDELVIEVSDDGPGPGASSHQGTGTSVGDLGQRLRLIYGDRARLALEPSPAGGCLARLRLPVSIA